MKQAMKLGLGAMALGVCVAAQAAAPVITSFSENGVLVCSNLVPGSVASLEWASAIPNGPWSNWPGMEAVLVDSNGMIQVSVPMFYRVVLATNQPPRVFSEPLRPACAGRATRPRSGKIPEVPHR